MTISELSYFAMIGIVSGIISGFLLRCYVENGITHYFSVVKQSFLLIIRCSLFYLLIPIGVMVSKRMRKSIIYSSIRWSEYRYNKTGSITEPISDKAKNDLIEVLLKTTPISDLLRISLATTIFYFKNFVSLSIVLIMSVVQSTHSAGDLTEDDKEVSQRIFQEFSNVNKDFSSYLSNLNL